VAGDLERDRFGGDTAGVLAGPDQVARRLHFGARVDRLEQAVGVEAGQLARVATIVLIRSPARWGARPGRHDIAADAGRAQVTDEAEAGRAAS
jgi:hypothetical protein